MKMLLLCFRKEIKIDPTLKSKISYISSTALFHCCQSIYLSRIYFLLYMQYITLVYHVVRINFILRSLSRNTEPDLYLTMNS